jgi:hypothetical protein
MMVAEKGADLILASAADRATAQAGHAQHATEAVAAAV